MNEYLIKKIKTSPTDEDWEQADVARISVSPWEEGKAININSFARLLYDDESIYVRMDTDEVSIVAKQTERDSLVCTDSCMEFFFCPNIEDGRYFNFEINALGTLFLGFGQERANRMKVSEDASLFCIKSQKTDAGWSISYKIPLNFIKKYVGELTEEMRGNFQKCICDDEKGHYFVWNFINTLIPDFHRPECFGSLMFEKHYDEY